jgi:alpha-tubulin suppressor-like RCC1 family protein
LQRVLDVATAGGWEGFTCAISDDGDADALGDDVHCWGDNFFGQLGFDHPPATPFDQRFSTIPVVVAGLPGAAHPVDVEAGAAGACVLLSDDTVWCWGAVLTGSGTPSQIALGTGPAVDLDVGLRHACVVTGGGSVECWGRGLEGQLGNGAVANSATPVVAAVTGAVSVSVGLDTTCVVRTGGSTACWGLNLQGQVGNGTSSPFEAAPKAVSVHPGPFADIVTGNSSTCAVVQDTTARCWGYNLGGQLGVEVDGNSAGPVVWGSTVG